jgi:hypothetical protein
MIASDEQPMKLGHDQLFRRKIRPMGIRTHGLAVCKAVLPVEVR